MADLVAKHGSAKHPERGPARQHPPGASEDLVAAVGKLSEALESAEHARGLLYGFHQLCGKVDAEVQEAVAMLRSAGMAELADEIDECLVGRDIIEGWWSFQLVESYDRHYWSVFRDVEHETRVRAGFADRHVYEAAMKDDEQQPS
jgi:hypothetical protein